jgi:hypothetical protein
MNRSRTRFNRNLTQGILGRILQLHFVFDNKGFRSRVNHDFLCKNLGPIRKIPIEAEDLKGQGMIK